MVDVAYLLIAINDAGKIVHRRYSFDFSETTRQLAVAFEDTPKYPNHTFKIFEVEVPNPDTNDLDVFFEHNVDEINTECDALYERTNAQ